MVVCVFVLELQGRRSGGGAALLPPRQVDVGVEACKKKKKKILKRTRFIQ